MAMRILTGQSKTIKVEEQKELKKYFYKMLKVIIEQATTIKEMKSAKKQEWTELKEILMNKRK